MITLTFMVKVSSASVVTDLRAFIAGKGRDFISSPRSPKRLWGPSSLLSNGNQEFVSGVKRPKCKADYSPPSSTEIKNTWSYTSTFQYVNRDSSVNTETRLCAGRPGVRFPAGAGNFSLCHRVKAGSVAHPASYLNGYWGLFPPG
jgi:hypothetical protein